MRKANCMPTYSIGSYIVVLETTDEKCSGRMSPMNKPIRVLLIEDDPNYVALVQQWLSGGTESAFVLDWASSLRSGLSHLQPGHVDVILLDLGLPDSGGLETFSKIKQQAGGVPLIVLSGDNTEELALQLVRASASEYLIYKSSSNGNSLAKAILDAVANKVKAPSARPSVRKEASSLH
jgi:DNA-binding NarL/FixJ family response regulator